MENPATWGQAEKVVNQTLTEIAEARRAGVIGLSQARVITGALREAGLLPEDGSSCGHCTEDGCGLEFRGFSPRKTRELILEHAGEGHAVMAHWRVLHPQLQAPANP